MKDANTQVKKTGFKNALRSIFIGLGLFPLYALVSREVEKSGGDSHFLMPLFMLTALLFLGYGFCKVLKIMWDNIPE